MVAILAQMLHDEGKMCLASTPSSMTLVVLKIHSRKSVCLTYKEKYIFVFYVIKTFLISFQIPVSHIFSLKGKKVVYFIFPYANDMSVISLQCSIRRE